MTLDIELAKVQNRLDVDKYTDTRTLTDGQRDELELIKTQIKKEMDCE